MDPRRPNIWDEREYWDRRGKREQRIEDAAAIRAESAAEIAALRADIDRENNRLLPIAEAARRLGVTLSTIHTWARKGFLTLHDVNNRPRVSEGDIEIVAASIRRGELVVLPRQAGLPFTREGR